MIGGAQPAESSGEITEANVEEFLSARGLHGPGWGLLPHVGPLRAGFKTSNKKGVSNKIGIRIDPLHEGNTDFDWSKIYASLDGEINEPTTTAMDDIFARRAVLKMSSLVVALIFDWLLQVNLQGDRLVKAVGVRACAAAWVIDPEHFDGASLTKLAKRLGYSSHAAISPEAADFSRRFGITNHFQAHAPGKDKNYATPPARN